MAKITRGTIETTRERLREGRERIEAIKNESEQARPELEGATKDAEETVDLALELLDSIARDWESWPAVKKFSRRILSREFIIAAFAIAAILGGAGGQESIGIAVAASGLVLGRSAVKAKAGIDS